MELAAIDLFFVLSLSADGLLVYVFHGWSFVTTFDASLDRASDAQNWRCLRSFAVTWLRVVRVF